MSDGNASVSTAWLTTLCGQFNLGYGGGAVGLWRNPAFQPYLWANGVLVPAAPADPIVAYVLCTGLPYGPQLRLFDASQSHWRASALA